MRETPTTGAAIGARFKNFGTFVGVDHNSAGSCSRATGGCARDSHLLPASTPPKTSGEEPEAEPLIVIGFNDEESQLLPHQQCISRFSLCTKFASVLPGFGEYRCTTRNGSSTSFGIRDRSSSATTVTSSCEGRCDGTKGSRDQQELAGLPPQWWRELFALRQRSCHCWEPRDLVCGTFHPPQNVHCVEQKVPPSIHVRLVFRGSALERRTWIERAHCTSFSMKTRSSEVLTSKTHVGERSGLANYCAQLVTKIFCRQSLSSARGSPARRDLIRPFSPRSADELLHSIHASRAVAECVSCASSSNTGNDSKSISRILLHA